jgi:hypothetical protein
MRIPMFFFAVCLALVPAAALAQDTTVELGGWFEILRPYLSEIVGMLAAAFVGWVALKLKQIFGLEIEARHRVALQSALANGANRGLAEIQKHASGTDVDVRSAVLAEGLRYVEKSVPDALKFFRLQPNDVVDHLEAHLAARLK